MDKVKASSKIRTLPKEVVDFDASLRREKRQLVFVYLGSPSCALCEDPEPRDIEHGLRTVGRVVGQPDPALSLPDRMRYWNVPGVSIAIIDGLEVAYAEGFGVAEFGGSTAVDTSTLFQAASLSKPVSTSGILQLVERGDLRLDEDVNAALTSWRLPESRFTETRAVTLFDLLTHTAGLSVTGFAGYPRGAPVPSLPQVLDGVPDAAGPNWPKLTVVDFSESECDFQTRCVSVWDFEVKRRGLHQSRQSRQRYGKTHATPE